jgi:acyl carrier protein phosphodiesterase
MNYLAHLYLAQNDAESWIGSLMGDFVRGHLDEGLAPAIRRGIWLHRKIDAFTDAHPIARRSRQRIQPRFRRYAAILVDVFYDHYLARDWDWYSAISLSDFAVAVYTALQVHYTSLPVPMQRSAAYMIANDLLLSYREIAGIGRSLRGIESRLRRESRLAEALSDLERNYDALAGDFAAFLPEVAYYAKAMVPP